MLLYNQRKEFVGIDEDDLNGLGFQDINELQNESNDFADLFVKKPGFIHNFKNFSWIDFILHSESDEAKAVIHAKGKNYSCTLNISPFYFTSDENGYAVFVKNLRPLKGAEDAEATKDLELSGGIKPSAAPISAPVKPDIKIANQPSSDTLELDISLDEMQLPEAETFNAPVDEPELPSFEQSYSQELTEPDPLDIPESLEVESNFVLPTENEFGAPIDIDYDSLMMDDSALDQLLIEEELIEAPEPVVEEVPLATSKPMLGDYVSSGKSGEEHLSDLIRAGDYQYDPQIAADELGLPVDLIEEFIGDFIDQAHEFYDDLYASVNADDFDNVQILSHKLKGVAANLRVEDAFDVLSVVNISKDTEEILPNLNYFYKIIAKLEGKEIIEEEPAPMAPTAEPEAEHIEIEEDSYDIGIKQPDDGPLLIDEEVNSNELYDELLATAEETEKSTEAQDDDDIYGDDLLLSSDSLNEDDISTSELSTADDDDIYGDDLLLSSDNLNEDDISASELSTTEDDDIYDDLLGDSISIVEDETTDKSNILELDEDDLYGDLLGTPTDDTLAKEASPSVDVKLNFDSQRTANELGIPLDIVQEFIQDFKKQINIHQNDFDAAVSEKNMKAVNKTATLLKGMSDNLRLTEISEVLKGLQVEKDINNTAKALATLQAYAVQL